MGFCLQWLHSLAHAIRSYLTFVPCLGGTIFNGRRRSFEYQHSRFGIPGQHTCNPHRPTSFAQAFSRVYHHSRPVNTTSHSWPARHFILTLLMAAHPAGLVAQKLPQRPPQICRTARLIVIVASSYAQLLVENIIGNHTPTHAACLAAHQTSFESALRTQTIFCDHTVTRRIAKTRRMPT
ncbi:hypothetical protein C8R47DRAFT_794615 [Mycena vitilis]|nr:hypothetical protein C8R47DRAFT_794615 [Mycena vitilis]